MDSEQRKTFAVSHLINTSPSKEHWISTSADQRGMEFNYVIWNEEQAGIELYIDTGDKEQDKRILDWLHEKKQRIETDFGGPLDWQRLDEKRASRIRYVIRKGGLRDEDKWSAVQDAMIDDMARFAQVLKLQLQELRD